jgi:hypothetical protein
LPHYPGTHPPPPPPLTKFDKYYNIIKLAATQALEQYDKYIPAARDKFEKLLRFNPKVEPAAYPKPPHGEQHDPEKIRAFFGHIPRDKNALGLLLDWNNYVEAWPTIPQRLKDLGVGKFWASQEVTKLLDCGPLLPELGKWYANTPHSNVAPERAFATMRSFETGSRLSMHTERLREYVMGRVNKDIVKKLLNDSITLPTPAPAPTSSSSSSSSSSFSRKRGRGE